MKNIDFVTGPGSSGTTFLIRLLAEMKLTSVSGLAYNRKRKGGKEFIIDKNMHKNIKEFPSIIKDPRIMFGDLEKYYDRLIQKGANISRVILCWRDFDQAAKSRIARNLEFSSYGDIHGEGNTKLEKQKDFYNKTLQKFISFISSKDIEITIINYDYIGDQEYLYLKLLKLYPSLSKDIFISSFNKIYNKDYRNSY